MGLALMIEYTDWKSFAEACIEHLKTHATNYDDPSEVDDMFYSGLASYLTVISATNAEVSLRLRVNVGEPRDSAIFYTGPHPPTSFFPLDNVGATKFNSVLSALPQPTAHCYSEAIDENVGCDKAYINPLTYLFAGNTFVAASHVERKVQLETALQTVLLVMGARADFLLYLALVATKPIYNLLLEWEHQGIDVSLLKHQLLDVIQDNVFRCGRKLPKEDLVAWFKYVRGGDYTQEELNALVNFVKE